MRRRGTELYFLLSLLASQYAFAAPSLRYLYLPVPLSAGEEPAYLGYKRLSLCDPVFPVVLACVGDEIIGFVIQRCRIYIQYAGKAVVYGTVLRVGIAVFVIYYGF